MNNFIIISDIHFYHNPPKSYKRPDGTSSWLKMQIDVISDLLEWALDEGVYTVIHNGDLFEEKNRIPVQVYNAVWNLFNKYKGSMKFIFNTGNHDILTTTYDSSLRPFSDIAQVISEPTLVDGHMMFIPHGGVEGIAMLPPEEVDNPLLFLHEDIAGLVYGETDFEPDRYAFDSEKLCDLGWKHIFNGHIHKPQKLNCIWNIGSPIRQDWGEAGDQKRFLYYADGEVNSVPITTGPKFIAIDELADDSEGRINENNFYRFDISTEQVHRDIFKRWNVSYRIVKSTSTREIRLKDSNKIDDDIFTYIDITETTLNKDKLKTIGNEFLGEI